MIDEEFREILKEATTSIERELELEDEGWIRLGGTSGEALSDTQRITAVKKSRIYYTHDPLAKQAIRLWTDYTFGTGMSFKAKDENTQRVLEGLWYSRNNQSVLSARGQRRSSDKLLVDGEVFFAIFLGPSGQANIRRIDPLEITEIITDPDDIEKTMLYKRDWFTQQGQQRTTYYRSWLNKEDKPGIDAQGSWQKANDDALVYHMAYNTISQRGNPLLLPALDWIKQYRRFLASRVAVMLALARFAWKVKVQGGQSAVTSAKAVYNDERPEAGSMAIENMGADLQPIKTDSGARNAYDDGRMLRLQVSAAVGIPEQYFGDISIGNLATAKTVELPMMKMFQSYQGVWSDVYQDIDELVLEHNGISPEKWYIDRDFPAIAPEDAFTMAQSLSLMITAFPELAYSPDVMQQALISMGINNPGEVIDALQQEAKGNPNIKLAKVLREFRRSIDGGTGEVHNL